MEGCREDKCARLAVRAEVGRFNSSRSLVCLRRMLQEIYLESRSLCLAEVVCWLGLHRRGRHNLVGLLHRDIAQSVAHTLWAARCDPEVWGVTLVKAKKPVKKEPRRK